MFTNVEIYKSSVYLQVKYYLGDILNGTKAIDMAPGIRLYWAPINYVKGLELLNHAPSQLDYKDHALM